MKTSPVVIAHRMDHRDCRTRSVWDGQGQCEACGGQWCGACGETPLHYTVLLRHGGRDQPHQHQPSILPHYTQHYNSLHHRYKYCMKKLVEETNLALLLMYIHIIQSQ